MANTKHKSWKIVMTPAVTDILTKLKYCQENSISRFFIDRPDIGKTVAAKYYRDNNENVAYVDCSQCKTRTQFIRALARAIGLNGLGRLKDVRDEVIEHIAHLDTPLVILDEAGDLDYTAFLEIKAIWNAMERECGWWLQGAVGLKRIVERMLENQKVGYAEIFRRMGSDWQTVTPQNEADYVGYFRHTAKLVAAANAPGVDLDTLLKIGKTDEGTFQDAHTKNKHSLRQGTPLSLDRLRDNIVKSKQAHQKQKP